MDFKEIIVIVKIVCNGVATISRVDVVPIAGNFDRGMVLRQVQKNHPGCTIEIIDVEWVVSKHS